jgi:hypothetical protein
MPGSRAVIAVGFAVGLFVTEAHAGRVEFTEAAIGCPSEDGLIAAYKAVSESSPDFKTVKAVVNHYDCEWIDKGVKLTLISENAIVSVVVRPHVFGKDVWYYVPTRSVKAAPTD